MSRHQFYLLPAPLKSLFYQTIKMAVHLLFKVGWRLNIIGQEKIPKEGRIIFAANHRSFADPPLVGVSVPGEVHFLAKEELFRFRPFGWIIKNLNAHPLNRKGSDIGAFKLAQGLLEKDKALIVFPEGKRSKSDHFGKPKPGVGLLAMLTGSPVVPTYIHNSGNLKSFKKLIVSFGYPLDPKKFSSYQFLAEETMRQIQQLKNGC